MTTTAGDATVPTLLFGRASSMPHAVALREKHRGCWRSTTWADYGARVTSVARGLAQLGVVAGDRVAIQADNRPEWLFVDVAVQALGAATVAVPAVAEPDAVGAALAQSKAKVVVAEDEEQVDKLLSVTRKLPKLVRIVVVDPRGVDLSADPRLMTLVELEALGATSDLDVVASAAAVGLDALATDAHSHRALFEVADRSAVAVGTDDRSEVLSFLPLGRIDERVVSEVNAVRQGYVVNFGDGGDLLAQDLRDTQPTCVLGVPEVWEALMAGVTTRMAGAGWLQRTSYRVWLRSGMEIGRRRRSGEGLSPVDRVRSGAAWLLLQRPLQIKLGLSRVRRALIGDGVLDPQVVDFFWAIGVPLHEGDGVGAAA